MNVSLNVYKSYLYLFSFLPTTESAELLVTLACIFLIALVFGGAMVWMYITMNNCDDNDIFQ